MQKWVIDLDELIKREDHKRIIEKWISWGLSREEAETLEKLECAASISRNFGIGSLTDDGWEELHRLREKCFLCQPLDVPKKGFFARFRRR